MTSSADKLDREAALEARDKGMQLALDINAPVWCERAQEALRRYLKVAPANFQLEDFRFWWLANGGERPPSHNAWGALARRARRHGIIVPTGYAPAKSVRTRGHPVLTYRSAP